MRSIKYCRSIAWARRPLPGLMISGLLLLVAAAPASAATATTGAASGLRHLAYLGNSSGIPGRWPVLDLARHFAPATT